MTLQIRKSHYAENVFALLGANENSMTYALGWVLDNCPEFRKLFLQELTGKPFPKRSKINIDLQKYDKKYGGFTDMEIHCAGLFHLIIEAKRGPILPSRKQLDLYAKRFTNSERYKWIISLSSASKFVAKSSLEGAYRRIPSKHYLWSEVKCLAQKAREKTIAEEEKSWLDHFVQHLDSYVIEKNQRREQVFVVSLSARRLKKSKDYTWIDVVEETKKYFHPVGFRGFPDMPLKYIGFRYRAEGERYSRVQSVHEVIESKSAINLRKVNSKWINTNREHFVYKLGPGKEPPTEMRLGNKIQRNRRVWCDREVLLSGKFNTLSDVVRETDRLMRNNSEDHN